MSAAVLECESLRDLRHMEARAAGALADWLVRLEVEGKAAGTLYQYARQVAPLLREYPDAELEDYTPSMIESVLADVPRQSRHITRSIYNSFFSWADDQDRIPRNPMAKVARIRPAKTRPKSIFTAAEVGALEGQGAPHGQLFTILFGSGLRRKEARELRKDRVDMSLQRIYVVSGKGDKDRIIPVELRVMQAFADLDLLYGLRPDEHWFSLARSEKNQGRRWRTHPLGDTTFETWYARRLEACGVRYLNPHQTRHTHGHMLREKGFDIEERALLMGHESITTTQKYYGHLTVEDVAKKIAQL